MPSPLDIIQNIAQQTLQLAKAGGKEQGVSVATTGESPENTFSNLLSQALQPQQNAIQTSTKNGKATGKAISDEIIGESSPESIDKATTELPTSEMAALQAQLIAVTVNPAAPITTEQQQTGLLDNLSQLVTQSNQQPAGSTQPTGQSAQASIPQASIPTAASFPMAAPVTTTGLPSSAQTTTEGTPAPSGEEPESKTNSVEMAQSFGMTTLSPEALGLMGLPIALQAQQVIQQAPLPPASGETAPAVASQAVPNPDNATPAISPEAGLTASATPDSTQTPAFEQALQTATQPNFPAVGQENVPPANSAPLPELATEPVKSAELTESLTQPVDLAIQTPNANLTDASPETNPQAIPPQTLQPSADNTNTADDNPPSDPFMSLAAEQTAPPKPKQASENKSFSSSLNAVADIQEKLSALNGEIETLAPESNTETPETFSLPEGETTITESTTDAMPTLMPTEAQATISVDNTIKTTDKLPTFMSPAANPADQVADGAVYSVKNGHKELILKLNPDNLGEVRINLISHGNNGVSARLIASNPESHALLKTQAEALKTSLEAQGIQVERLSVVLAGHTESSANTSSQKDQSQQPQQFQQQPQTASSHQQQSFQQPGQNPNLFFQGGGQFQHRQGFAQNPGASRYGQSDGGGLTDSSTVPENTGRRNDNGNLNVLA